MGNSISPCVGIFVYNFSDTCMADTGTLHNKYLFSVSFSKLDTYGQGHCRYYFWLYFALLFDLRSEFLLVEGHWRKTSSIPRHRRLSCLVEPSKDVNSIIQPKYPMTSFRKAVYLKLRYLPILISISLSNSYI